MRKIEIKWVDEIPKDSDRVECTWTLTGKNAAMAKYTIELQLANDEKDIVIESIEKDPCAYYEQTVFHLTKKQAKGLWLRLDGIAYNDKVVIKFIGVFWK
jgi:hypothetical protein